MNFEKKHEIHFMTMEEKKDIFKEYTNGNKNLTQVLESRGYFWTSPFRSLLVKHVIDFNILNKQITPLPKKIDYKGILEEKTDSINALWKNYEPELKEFIFKSNV